MSRSVKVGDKVMVTVVNGKALDVPHLTEITAVDNPDYGDWVDIADIYQQYYKDMMESDYESFVVGVADAVSSVIDKKVYAHNTDIRRANTQPQAGDRREYGPNQYVYGTVLELTNNHGFYEWDEIIEEVKEMCE